MDKPKKFDVTIKIIAAVLLIVSAVCIYFCVKTCRELPSQYVYVDWRGDNETRFSQISVFVSESSAISINDIYAFRNKMSKELRNNTVSSNINKTQYTDCWSCVGSAKVANDSISGNTSVLAIGGNYFDFHPLPLLYGSYLRESDIMQDAVILDDRLAWYLFGAVNVVGMTINIDGTDHLIVGIVEHESDNASSSADSSETRIFMSYEAFCNNFESKPSITCYEVVLPNPVKNYAINLVNDTFSSKRSEIIENTHRFSFDNLVKIINNFPERSMNSDVPYPYWENAARYNETRAAYLLLIGLLSFLFPFIAFITLLAQYIKYGQWKLETDYLPIWKDSAEESIRKIQRKRWEKKHPNMK